MLDTILSGAIEYAQTMSHWETTAVLLGIAYLVLAMRQSQWCWYAAFGSTAIFSWLFFDVSLVMESALNVYYLAMAVYGWLAWRNGSPESPDLPIQRWSLQQHGMAIGGVVLISLMSGWLLTNNTTAALPYLDSFTTWGAVVTTFMVARKVLENWVYWFVLDAVSIPLYAERGLYVTAMLFALYLVIIVFGFLSWHRQYAAGPDVVA